MAQQEINICGYRKVTVGRVGVKDTLQSIGTWHRQCRRPEGSISLSLGDVATLFKENPLCGQCRIARVEQLIPGTDDNVGAATVKRITKTGRVVTVKWPVQKTASLFNTGGRDQ